MKKGKSRLMARKDLIKNRQKSMKRGGQRFDPQKAYNHKDYDGSQSEKIPV